MAEFIKKIATSDGEKQIDFQSLGNFPVAQAGQLLKVKTVDENGKPTEWEAVSSSNLFNDEKTAEEARENLGITELFAKVGNMYVWGKLGEIPASYKILDAVANKAVSTASIQVTWEYADSITIADDGTISLVNPKSTSFKQNSTISSLVNVMIGKYARCTSGGNNGPHIDDYFQPLGTVIYFPSDCVFTRDADTIRLEASKAHRVEGCAKSTGYTDYLMDANRNAYPDNGQHTDGNTYIYIDKLAALAGGGTKIEVGSYMGTGVYGSSNKNSLTFGFKPKVVIFVSPDNPMMSPVYINGASKMGAFKAENTNYNTVVKVSASGNTISWYNDQNHYYQGNASGTTYLYVAIG